jgi:simple sugar transport system permease protein
MDEEGTDGRLQARLAGFLPKGLRRSAGDLPLLIVAATSFAAMSLARPGTFPTIENLRSMSVQLPEIGIPAIAMLLTMITGGIDLSGLATANLSGIAAAWALAALVPPGSSSGQAAAGIAAACTLALAVGAAGGVANGLLIARAGIPAILATLGTMTGYTGIALVLTKGEAAPGIPEFGLLGSFPWPPLLFVGLSVLAAFVLGRTAFGVRLYLLGASPRAARFAGIDEQGVILRTYLLSGLLAAATGLLFLARNSSAKADYGSSYVLGAILVAILGGVDPAGGSGKVSGLILALLSLQFLSTGLNMLLAGVRGSNFAGEMAWGGLIILVMAAKAVTKRAH